MTDTEIDWSSEAAHRLQARPHRQPKGDPMLPPNVDHKVAPTSTVVLERVVASIGLPWHPPLRDIIDGMRDAADEVHANGAAAVALARELAAKGYPSSTLGDGGSRGTDPTSSTERAAGLGGDPKKAHKPSRWVGVDVRLAAAYATAAKATKDLDNLIADIVQHAEDLDYVPVGTGECQACGRFCRPDKAKPGNRLRSGLCPTDYRAWLRANQPVRTEWVRQRRLSFTDPDTEVLHTPEPDHDIDLSSEVLSP